MDIDGEFFLGISSTTIAKFYLYQNKEVQEDLLNEIVEFEIFNKFYDRAITYISGAFKTEKGIIDYLKKLYAKKKKEWVGEGLEYDITSTITAVVERLKEIGLINDAEFARMFVESRRRSKPRSRSVLINELVVKGVSRDIAKSVVEDIADDELIYKLYIKKYKERIFDIDSDSKIVSFLARKGFSWDEISKLERKLKDDIGE